jgi:NADH-quinone oxidoreductase subunit L
MHEDRGFSRFFACMSLFTFSMLGIVLANNFIQLFIFWELVGVSSYLLIGFWFEKPSAADAAKKAFITNRLGDFGFLLGILIIWGLLGSLNFTELQTDFPLKLTHAAKIHHLSPAFVSLMGLLIFCGAMGKSAQFPLHVWLPDAMEGPTPVSALIHAATMVAAGVYMLCRVLFLFNDNALHVIAYIGGFTALLAALIAVQQNDIKRILAFDVVTARLHGHGRGPGRPDTRNVSSYHARIFQGVVVPGRRLGHPCAARGAGRLEDGRPAQKDGHHVLDLSDRHTGFERRAAVQRILLEGFHPGPGA